MVGKTHKVRSRLIRYPVSLTVEGKHTIDVYLVNNLEEKRQLGIEILKNWKDEGYLECHLSKAIQNQNLNAYCKEKTSHHFDDLLKMKKDLKEEMKVKFNDFGPTLTINEHIEQVKNDFSKSLDLLNIYGLAEEALKNKDGTKAWEVIDFFSERDFSYQKVKEQTFSNVNYKYEEVKKLHANNKF